MSVTGCQAKPVARHPAATRQGERNRAQPLPDAGVDLSTVQVATARSAQVESISGSSAARAESTSSSGLDAHGIAATARAHQAGAARGRPTPGHPISSVPAVDRTVPRHRTGPCGGCGTVPVRCRRALAGGRHPRPLRPVRLVRSVHACPPASTRHRPADRPPEPLGRRPTVPASGGGRGGYPCAFPLQGTPDPALHQTRRSLRVPLARPSSCTASPDRGLGGIERMVDEQAPRRTRLRAWSARGRGACCLASRARRSFARMVTCCCHRPAHMGNWGRSTAPVAAIELQACSSRLPSP